MKYLRSRQGGVTGVWSASIAWEESARASRAAIVDRLTFGGSILETGTDFYRLEQTRVQQAAASS